MRTSLFWDVTQRRLLVRCRSFGSSLSVLSSRVKQSKKIFLDSFPFEDETNRLSRNVCNSLLCITSQNSKDLIIKAVEIVVTRTQLVFSQGRTTKICITYVVRTPLYIFTQNSTLGIQLHVSALYIGHGQVVL
jgi:hypothetical protein